MKSSFEKIDPDLWSLFELFDLIKSLGYSKWENLWYGGDDGCFKAIDSDKAAINLASLVILNENTSINIFVEHVANKDATHEDNGLDQISNMEDNVDDIHFSNSEEDLNDESEHMKEKGKNKEMEEEKCE